MTEKEIRKGVQTIMDTEAMYPRKVEMFLGFIEQQQREAYAAGKAQAYKEMFSVICELAGKEKTEKAAEEIKETETR